METTQNEGTRRPAPSEPMQQLKLVGRPRLNAEGGCKPLKRTTGSYTNQLKLDTATHLERNKAKLVKACSTSAEGAKTGRKYTPFVVFKAQPSKDPKRILEYKQKRRGFGIYVWEEIEELHEAYELECFGNPKGWWNHELSVEFLHFHFGKREDMQRPVLLLWDDFSGHWTEDVRRCARELNVELLKVPEGATSVAQPADVAWNPPLKSRMRGLWINFLREQLKRHAKDTGDPFCMDPPNRRIVANWIAQGWEMLSPATIANGFKKCGYPCVQDADHVGAALAVEAFADDVIAELQKLHFVDESYGDIDSDADFDRTE
ncbi:Hypothetical protein PHPALM_16848 [Phytophthora palmivora]|uniref:DDE-1 domain-containing protein n=1 Tax=Phytophthora palmivora TaxID=4796 RepID=A0A2P4XNT2_9STRA|nr:Hypothetical protein PHPALM_16848 [Phytophthora palmivora]